MKTAQWESWPPRESGLPACHRRHHSSDSGQRFLQIRLHPSGPVAFCFAGRVRTDLALARLSAHSRLRCSANGTVNQARTACGIDWMLTHVSDVFPLLQAVVPALVSLKPSRGVLSYRRGAQQHTADGASEHQYDCYHECRLPSLSRCCGQGSKVGIARSTHARASFCIR